jgi:hypothetical protein
MTSFHNVHFTADVALAENVITGDDVWNAGPLFVT